MANTTTKKKTASASGRKATPRKKRSAAPETGNQDPLLREYFIEELKDIYWAEKKLVSSLPKLQKAASTEALQGALAEHTEVTREQVARLEEIFDMLGEKAQAKKCEAMEGIVKESETVVEDTEEGTATRDVALIIAAQKAEHYEIATYGGLAQLAKTLGYDEVADLLATTLDEEKEADEKLTGIAENDINYQASLEGGEEEEENEGEEEEEEEE